MKVLIVEDVTLVAERIADLASKYLQNCKITLSYTLDDAQYCITEETYDLVFLDLNLNGKSGFDLLASATAASFQTIIVTANREQALAAFDFGVLDFIGKPIVEKRFKVAIDRFLNAAGTHRERLKYLTIKSKGVIQLIKIEDIEYIRASGNYAEIHISEKSSFLHDKNLDKLRKILPDNFIRVHRSYLIPSSRIHKIIKHGGGKYSIELASGRAIPLSRDVYKERYMNS